MQKHLKVEPSLNPAIANFKCINRHILSDSPHITQIIQPNIILSVSSQIFS